MKKIILTSISVVVIAFLISGIFLLEKKQKSEEKKLSLEKAGEVAINFINENLLEEEKASLVKVNEIGDIYKITLKIRDREYESYITKDGKFFFPQGYEIKEKESLSKKDMPDVKLFVMSYCPFGLQAEKGILPVLKLFKDKITAGIFFVDYAMHGEEEVKENLRQYCIQKEEREKYLDYLECFVKSGNSESCLSQSQIDKEKLNSCISQTDSDYKITEKLGNKNTWMGNFPPFDIHKDLNEKYEVSGSPTLVINDAVIVTNRNYCPSKDKKCVVISGFNRSPEKFKEAICQAFTNKPKECDQTLSSEVPSPGFGEGTGSGEGSCE